MGAGQSHPNAAGGGSSSRSSTATKTSYYELLEVDRSATEDEIKKAYRRKALTLHPDRNYGDVERVTALFTEVQSAYEVLSDAQERAWYDAHEDAILSGYDPTDNPDPGAEDDADEYEHNAGLTSADDIVRVMGRFNRNVEFSDAPAGFYGFLGGVFGKLAQEEMVAARREGLDAIVYPSFGRKDDGHEDVVRGFYGVWAGFSTRKTFAWRDRYRPSDAPDRRTRRYIEKENQTARNEGIREFNDAVRSLVAFVRKRDPRFIANQQSEEEREKALREATAARAAKQRAENTKKMEAEVLPEWAKHREPDEVVEEDDEESEEEQFECVACRKTFKSENQFEAHEKSKKHVKAVQALRRKMQKEGVSLDLSEDEEGGIMDDGNYPMVEQVEEHENTYPIMDDTQAQGNDASEEELGHDEELDMGGDVRSDEELDIATKELHLNGQAEDPKDGTTRDSLTSNGDPHHSASATDVPETKHDRLQQESDSEQDVGSSSDDEPKSSTIPSLSTSPQQKSAPEPKLGKAAQKRAKKAAQAAITEESDLQHRCASCQAAFPSKTRLFQHIKDHPGHAAPVDSGKKGKGGGGKSKKR